MPKDKAELMRISRANRTSKFVKCEVYLPKIGLKKKKAKLSEYVEKELKGKYKPKLD